MIGRDDRGAVPSTSPTKDESESALGRPFADRPAQQARGPEADLVRRRETTFGLVPPHGSRPISGLLTAAIPTFARQRERKRHSSLHQAGPVRYR